MVRVWARIHALVSKQVHAKVTLVALLTSLVTFKTAFVTLRADAINFIVVARAVIPASSIEK